MFKIVKREEMSAGTVILNEIEAPLIAAKAKPGQFVILKANEEGERIPLTIADKDTDKGTLTVIYMVVGKSTALFKSLQEGDGYQDVIGPLGKPTHLEKIGNDLQAHVDVITRNRGEDRRLAVGGPKVGVEQQLGHQRARRL